MPIKLVPRLMKGWKSEENKRFGFCLVISFVDSNTGAVLFDYAPLLTEVPIWEGIFKKLHWLDNKHKEYMREIEAQGLSIEVKT